MSDPRHEVLAYCGCAAAAFVAVLGLVGLVAFVASVGWAAGQ